MPHPYEGEMQFRAAHSIDPLSNARSVADPAINEVIDLDTGEIMDAKALIESFRYDDLVIERGEVLSRMQGKRPRYICDTCHVPVYLVSIAARRAFFFRHSTEDGSCPAQTRSPLTYDEICARKYHGLRESEPHKRIKVLVVRSLSADPMFRDINPEKKWAAANDPKRYRRPDVQADCDQGKLAFEVQLSTTFLSVVVGRRDFYRDDGALLVWVFGNFDPAYRLMTTDDLLFANNSNIVVIDEETTAISEAARKFHLRCHYREPVRNGTKIADQWTQAIIAFDELVQDRSNQRAYYFDFAGAEQALKDEIEAEAVAAIQLDEQNDRDEFTAFWREHGRNFKHTEANRARWFAIKDRLAAREIILPDFPDSDIETEAMVSCLLSAQAGVPVTYKLGKLIQIAHQVAESHPRLLVAFGHALNIYDRRKLIADQDVSRKWHDRLSGKDDEHGIAARLRERDPAFAPDADLLPLMSFLFPEVAEKVRNYIENSIAS